MAVEGAHGNFPPLSITRWREVAFYRRGRRLTTKQMRGVYSFKVRKSGFYSFHLHQFMRPLVKNHMSFLPSNIYFGTNHVS